MFIWLTTSFHFVSRFDKKRLDKDGNAGSTGERGRGDAGFMLSKVAMEARWLIGGGATRQPRKGQRTDSDFTRPENLRAIGSRQDIGPSHPAT